MSEHFLQAKPVAVMLFGPRVPSLVLQLATIQHLLSAWGAAQPILPPWKP